MNGYSGTPVASLNRPSGLTYRRLSSANDKCLLNSFLNAARGARAASAMPVVGFLRNASLRLGPAGNENDLLDFPRAEVDLNGESHGQRTIEDRLTGG
jgi:hypothetical protein